MRRHMRPGFRACSTEGWNVLPSCEKAEAPKEAPPPQGVRRATGMVRGRIRRRLSAEVHVHPKPIGCHTPSAVTSVQFPACHTHAMMERGVCRCGLCGCGTTDVSQTMRNGNNSSSRHVIGHCTLLLRGLAPLTHDRKQLYPRPPPTTGCGIYIPHSSGECFSLLKPQYICSSRTTHQSYFLHIVCARMEK